MAYTPKELELISIATELVGERGLEEQSKAFLARFPESLKKMHDYFLSYMESQKILDEYHQIVETRKKAGRPLTGSEKASLDKNFLKKLAKIEARMRSNFERAENEQEADQVSYLKAHFELRCQLDSEGHLSLRESRTKDPEDHLIETQMQELAQKGFIPAQILRADAPNRTAETELEAYKDGHQKGDLACKIRLANMFLNNKLSKVSTKGLGITESEVIAVLQEGVRKGMPSAIAAVSRFLKDYMNTTVYLYNGASTSKELKEIEELGRLVVLVCPNEEIKEKIRKAIKLGKKIEKSDVLDKAVLAKSKKLRDETSKQIDELAESLRLSEGRANQMAADLVIEARLPVVVDLLINKIEVQKEKYQKKLEKIIQQEQEKSNINDPRRHEILDKIKHLEIAKGKLIGLKDLKPEKSDPSSKLEEVRGIVKELDKNTKDLPPSNPLKRFINRLIGTLFNSGNYLKSQAHNVAKESEKMLFAFQQKMQNNIGTHKKPTSHIPETLEKSPYTPKRH